MENRARNLIISNSGGTASKFSKTYKVSLPTKWIEEMGLDGNNREVELSFDGEKISISKKITPEEFIKQKSEKKHNLEKLTYYDGDKICGIIIADFTDKTISYERLTDNMVKTPFGKKTTPNWNDFLQFLEERCISRNRAGLREYLEVLSLDKYEPMELVKKTEGRMAEDKQWIKTEKI